jgi:hypothetical protein
MGGIGMMDGDDDLKALAWTGDESIKILTGPNNMDLCPNIKN